MGHEINITKKLLAFLIKLADTLVCIVGQEFLSCLEFITLGEQLSTLVLDCSPGKEGASSIGNL